MIKKLQNISIAFLFVTLFFLLMQVGGYWWKGNSAGDAANRVADFVAPTSQQMVKPLNTEIDFIDIQRKLEETLSEIETNWAKLAFSTYGASLDSLVFKQLISGKMQEIPVVFPPVSTEQEKRCFLIGLAEKTPYYYTLEKVEKRQKETGDGIDSYELVYKAETDAVEIQKTFIVYNDISKINLKLDIKPKQRAHDSIITNIAGNIANSMPSSIADRVSSFVGGNTGAYKSVEPRILFSSPFIPSLGVKDAISSLVIDQNGVFKKTARDKTDMQRGFYKPGLFGSEDTYFVHALIEDKDQFAQRAYYSIMGNNALFSFVEGPSITAPYSGELSFYFGPKEMSMFTAVGDVRLEKTLGYSGVLAPLSRFLLRSLQWLYGYIGNYGWAIIVLIMIMQFCMIPFTLQGERSAKKQKEFQKKMAYLQQRYRNDSEGLNRERALLIQKNGIPGLGGCLPVLLFRVPTFFALNAVLNSAIELYQAPFLWINDLSAVDPYFIFPIFVALGMFAQAFTFESEQRVQMLVMALVMGWFTSTLSAGLALYIATSTLLGVFQTSLLRFFRMV